MSQLPNLQATLLLVDDEPFNLEILSEHLLDAGYRVELAADGEEAWSWLTRAGDQFDAVLLDRMMPGLNGMEVLRRMQAHPQLAALPVVLQTAIGSAEAIREGLEAGAYYYLTKPFEREMLLAIVAAAVAQHRARRSIKQATAQPLDGLDYLSQGVFELATLDDAQRVAALLGRLAPAPERVALGLSELIVNAIEHGNLGLGYEDKRELMQSGHWRDAIEERQRLPEFAGKRVQVRVQRQDQRLVIEVEDEGAGFEWQKYMDFDPVRVFDPNGRGISMARTMSFDELHYTGKGNVAVASVKL
ncbi:response regulator [Chitinimonas sp.]|uniref:response regulator n=1 Tax=Chitinimonas sp. TaxID=1934313 RepID=UPI0035B207D9